MTNVLLINPSYNRSYGSAKASIVNPIHPTLGLATIAGSALARGHKVEILDLSWRNYDFDLVRGRIRSLKPDVVGVTATTPLMNQLRDISVLVKDISKNIKVVGGGAHPSAMPEETLRQSLLDVVFVGEADFSFADYCDGVASKDIPGLLYRNSGRLVSTGLAKPIANLDDLPFPAWHLYDLNDYHRISRLMARRPPVTMAEFSRGCVFKCDFCASKLTMSLGYRKKSPTRCAEEVKQMHALGFREFMLADDIFTSDQQWATAVCNAISATGVDMAWSCTNGIRVESANSNLFKAMRRAGCYRVSFGFESGSNRVLEQFGKGGQASVEQGRKAVQLARKSGIDTSGFFLLGLSPDTQESMDETIAYARSVPLDMMKFGVALAFPGTAMFNKYAKLGLIKSFDWDEYFIYTDKVLYAHENLTYDTIRRYMEKAYRQCILQNPGFIARRLLRGLRTGDLFWDMYYALKFFSLPATTKSQGEAPYYARDRWPEWDLTQHPPKEATYQVVHKCSATA